MVCNFSPLCVLELIFSPSSVDDVFYMLCFIFIGTLICALIASPFIYYFEQQKQDDTLKKLQEYVSNNFKDKWCFVDSIGREEDILYKDFKYKDDQYQTMLNKLKLFLIEFYELGYFHVYIELKNNHIARVQISK